MHESRRLATIEDKARNALKIYDGEKKRLGASLRDMRKKRKIIQGEREAIAAPESKPMPAIEDATSSSGKVLQKAEKDGDVVPVDTMASTVDEDKVDCVSAMLGKAHVDDGVSQKRNEGKEPKSKRKRKKTNMAHFLHCYLLS